MRKTSIFITLILSFVAFVTPSLSHAESACNLGPLVAELAKIQADTSLDEIEALNAEIFARRKLLDATIDCDKSGIDSRLRALNSLPDGIKSAEAYGKILEGLTVANLFYNNQKTETQHLGVGDLKAAARAIAKWRRETFIPLITLADNFLIWADNQQFLDKVSERLKQVSAAAFSLKLVNQNRVNNLFQKAQKSFETARAENDEAKKELNRGRAGVSLLHTNASLRALADTYQTFFDLQEALKKVI